MAQIKVSELTFCYEGSYDNIFENVSFSIDSDWKLGFIGRNGKGKTTFLNLLFGKYDYQGSISSSLEFDYFPYQIDKKYWRENTIDVINHIEPNYELWKICRELGLLNTDSEILYREYNTLSFGERTKVMLAVLFSKENNYLLIDEPTNHLDMLTRINLINYLQKKKGFILVSHDRYVLDECVDHVLVINRETITVEKGNFSSWYDNKQKKDAFEMAENDKLKSEIDKLEKSYRRTSEWARKVESSKIGFNKIKEHDRFIDSRAYIAEKSRRMQQRSKNLERRMVNDIDDKKKLLKDIEEIQNLKITNLKHHKDRYIYAKDFTISYDGQKNTIEKFNLELNCGDRIVLQGKNGCGKSSIIKAIIAENELQDINQIHSGILEVTNGLIISYINQDTSFLSGKLDEFIYNQGISNSLFKTVLRQLDFERIQFEKNLEQYSEGQKKKVLITSSLLHQAHLYIWDEPLNYVDVFSRMQIENLILKYKPTMLIVEHDKLFSEKIATKIVNC